ncbi:Ig-like domain-containing protein [Roseisolibacter agri]|uniref:BIG2 domain-containing protein n=1 Tax=Roseisolibacter agri TaxID=2014610 RepID=A0AA37QDR3_9BACT|nr:Ig-like domain-containing protein [Roseisolibacter agri]GLC27021.1 hypothetical protein rosag_35340 [Roseisolibacter agri]
MSARSAFQSPRALRRAAFAFLLAAAAACSDTTELTGPVPPPPAPVVGQIDITASTAPLLVHGSRQLTTRVLSVEGFTLHDHAVTWSSSDTSVAGVTPQGVVFARAVGETVVAATAGRARAEVRIVVAPLAVDAIAFSRGTASLAAGETGAFGAITFAADGRVLSDRTVFWSSSDTAIVVVNAQGQIRGVRPGTARIVAESEGRRASAAVTVTPGVLSTEPTTWTLRAYDLVGAGVRCTVDGIAIRLAQRGALVEGEVAGGARIECSPLAGAQPPYVTPLPPVGRIEGTIDGRTLRLQATTHRWTLEGTLSADGRTIEGTAWVVDPAVVNDWGSSIAALRTGRFRATR